LMDHGWLKKATFNKRIFFQVLKLLNIEPPILFISWIMGGQKYSYFH